MEAIPPLYQPAPTPLPPELERFWTAFATSQIRKGRRDIGAMVQAALEYLFERGTQRLKPMMRSQEDFEAFRNALKDEFGRIDKALEAHPVDAPNLDMETPYQPKQFRIVRREDDSKMPADAVVVTYWPRTLGRRDELQRYRDALEKQWAATLQAIDENTKRLLEARQQLQAQLVPYSPAFYNAATQLLADFDAVHRPQVPQPTPEEVAQAEALAQQQAAPVQRNPLSALINHFLGRISAAVRFLQNPPPVPQPPPPTEFEYWLSALNGAAVSDLPTREAPPAAERFRVWLIVLWHRLLPPRR